MLFFTFKHALLLLVVYIPEFSCNTTPEIGFYYTFILILMFIEASDQMSSCLTDIAGIISWTRNFIYHSTSKLFFNRWFQTRKCCLQFPQCNNWLYWCPRFFYLLYEVVRNTAPVLYNKSRYW